MQTQGQRPGQQLSSADMGPPGGRMPMGGMGAMNTMNAMGAPYGTRAPPPTPSPQPPTSGSAAPTGPMGAMNVMNGGMNPMNGPALQNPRAMPYALPPQPAAPHPQKPPMQMPRATPTSAAASLISPQGQMQSQPQSAPAASLQGSIKLGQSLMPGLNMGGMDTALQQDFYGAHDFMSSLSGASHDLNGLGMQDTFSFSDPHRGGMFDPAVYGRAATPTAPFDAHGHAALAGFRTPTPTGMGSNSLLPGLGGQLPPGLASMAPNAVNGMNIPSSVQSFQSPVGQPHHQLQGQNMPMMAALHQNQQHSLQHQLQLQHTHQQQQAQAQSQPSSQIYSSQQIQNQQLQAFQQQAQMQGMTIQLPAQSKVQSQSRVGPDPYGLLGFLDVIRIVNPDLNYLALGTDLTSLGLDLNSSDCLYATFNSPWSDGPSRRAVEHFELPRCYYLPPLASPSNKIAQFNDETLFYIFYAMTRDPLQNSAAQELSNREWKYLKASKVWIQKSPNGDGTCTYFDIAAWEKRKEDASKFASEVAEAAGASA